MKKILIFFLIIISYSFAQKSAPNFTLDNIDGKKVELQKLIGKGPILISFWATWCKPCMEELTELQKIYDELKPSGLQLLAISTDNEKSSSKVKPWIKSKNYSFTVLLDTNSDVARKYYAQSIPYTVVIDNSGTIVYTHVGYKKGDEIETKKVIQKLLEKN